MVHSTSRIFSPRSLHLCETAIDKQFRSDDVAAVGGRQKHHGLRNLIGRTESAERNTVGNHVFLRSQQFVVMTRAPFVTSQVALDDFVGLLHERDPSSWPHNAETSRPTVFLREGDWRGEPSLA